MPIFVTLAPRTVEAVFGGPLGTVLPMSSREMAAQELLGQIPQRTAISGVASRLLTYLTSGETPVGTRLPPERELAASLGVGRSAIRGALAALEILGIVEVRPGSGSYVAGTTSELLPPGAQLGNAGQP
jgi:GntR family transcriptional repressor for pyruvate dehydrogenase complex